MPLNEHGQTPFDEITDEAQKRFEAHLLRTYGTQAQMPEPGQIWIDTTKGAICRTIKVFSVHPGHRIPYAEIDDSIYGQGRLRLLAFGRWLRLKERS